MNKRNIILIVLGAIITSSVVVGVVAYRASAAETALVDAPPITFDYKDVAQPPAPIYPIPASILPIIQRLGIDQTLASQIVITSPADNSECHGGALAEPSACDTNKGIIFPAPLLQKTISQQNALFGHEWLHYAWSLTSPEDKTMLTPYIEQAYQNAKPYLDTRIAPYHLTSADSTLRINELHSYIGTEIADSLIPQPLLDHYKKYLPNRNALPSLYPYPVVVAPRYVAPVYVAPTPYIAPPPIYVPTVYTPVWTPTPTPIITPAITCQQAMDSSFTRCN